MFRSTIEKRHQYIAANSKSLEARLASTFANAGSGLKTSQPQRFPPIDDVFAALDRVASQAIAA